MKPFLIILPLLISFNGFGQTQPDSLGFTNKAEAKNLMVNGLKEGKWVEYVKYIYINNYQKDTFEVYTKDTNVNFYRLTVYVADRPYGIARIYDRDKILECTTHYSDGEKDGIEKWYDDKGNVLAEIPYKKGKINGTKKFYEDSELDYESPYINGKKNGIEKGYYKNGKLMYTISFDEGKRNGALKYFYENGKIKSETMYKNGVEGIAKNYDENGNEIK